jgi:hypothetical protein
MPKKPKPAEPKPMGRPRVGDAPITLMFPAKDLERAEAWGKRQKPPIGRTTAIRRLVRLALDAGLKWTGRSEGQ